MPDSFSTVGRLCRALTRLDPGGDTVLRSCSFRTLLVPALEAVFTSHTVNDAAPVVVAPATASPTAGDSATSAPAAVLVARGALVTHEHGTAGTAELVQLPDGKYQLVFRELSTSDGPDLRV